MEDALAAKTQAVEELSRELEEIRAAFGTEGVQQVNALITSFKVILSLSISFSFSSSCTLRLNICQCIQKIHRVEIILPFLITTIFYHFKIPSSCLIQNYFQVYFTRHCCWCEHTKATVSDFYFFIPPSDSSEALTIHIFPGSAFQVCFSFFISLLYLTIVYIHLLLQLQDFEAALKQRDGIITQLTANLQEAREEKDEIMKEFLELTEQSQKLHIQFQQVSKLLFYLSYSILR